MVDTYFEVKNDNNVVVIDDNYENLSFIHFSDILTVQASDERKGSTGLSWDRLSDGSYGKYESFSRTYMAEELGLLRGVPSYLGIRRVDSIGGSFAFVSPYYVYAIEGDYTSEIVGFKYKVNSMDLGAQYQMVSFSDLGNRVPSTSGLAIYNSDRKLIFDAELGFMQVMDSQYHIRDLYSSATQSFPVYNSNLPDIDYSRMFLITRQRPYATTGGTIIVNYRQYVPRLRKDANNQIYVDLGMWGAIGGNRLQQYQRVFSFMVAYVPF